ncbi:unnamed protein product, partial [Prorocentrum cordatum]
RAADEQAVWHVLCLQRRPGHRRRSRGAGGLRGPRGRPRGRGRPERRRAQRRGGAPRGLRGRRVPGQPGGAAAAAAERPRLPRGLRAGEAGALPDGAGPDPAGVRLRGLPGGGFQDDGGDGRVGEGPRVRPARQRHQRASCAAAPTKGRRRTRARGRP